jgi:chromosome segregation ATPase
MFVGKNEQEQIQNGKQVLADLTASVREYRDSCNKAEAELAYLDNEIKEAKIKADVAKSLAKEKEAEASSADAKALKANAALKDLTEKHEAFKDLHHKTVQQSNSEAAEIIGKLTEAKKDLAVTLSEVKSAEEKRDWAEGDAKKFAEKAAEAEVRLDAAETALAGHRSQSAQAEKDVQEAIKKVSEANKLTNAVTEAAEKQEKELVKAKDKAEAEIAKLKEEAKEEISKKKAELEKKEAELVDREERASKEVKWAKDSRAKLTLWKEEAETKYKVHLPNIVI